MFVDVNTKRCVGCGLCEENHPDIFVMGKRTAEVVSPIVSGDEAAGVRETAEDCPADAILIEE
jgi:ferredoxin